MTHAKKKIFLALSVLCFAAALPTGGHARPGDPVVGGGGGSPATPPPTPGGGTVVSTPSVRTEAGYMQAMTQTGGIPSPDGGKTPAVPQGLTDATSLKNFIDYVTQFHQAADGHKSGLMPQTTCFESHAPSLLQGDPKSAYCLEGPKNNNFKHAVATAAIDRPDERSCAAVAIMTDAAGRSVSSLYHGIEIPRLNQLIGDAREQCYHKAIGNGGHLDQARMGSTKVH